MRQLIDRLRTWRATEHWRRAASERALAEFARMNAEQAIGAHVLRLDEHEALVRVMYMDGRVPPARCWYAVPRDGGAIRALTFEEVASMESPWR